MEYPFVFDEHKTLLAILDGKSIARFGDGEIKLMLGKDCVSQKKNIFLGGELSRVLNDHNPNCIIGIPNIRDDTPNIEFWGKYRDDKYSRFYSQNIQYYSSFITRPDNAPWINTAEYWDEVKKLWAGKRILLVTGGRSSALRDDTMPEAKDVFTLFGPETDAYERIDGLQIRIEGMAKDFDSVILCLGATATCLAYRLSRNGIHALDLGHIGMFYRRFYK